MNILGNKELSESKQLLEVVFRHTPIMSVYLDARFNFIWVNPAYAATFNHDPSFFPGKNHFELYPNAENQAIFQRVVDSGEPHRVMAKPFEFPDQPERGVTYWDWSLVPVKDSGGKTTGLVFTLMDVTDRVRAEQAASESAALFQAVFEQAIDGMLLMDMESKRFIRANRQMQQLLGYTEAEIQQLGVKDIHPAADLHWVLACFEKQVRGELAVAPELPVLRKDGTVFFADISAAIVRVHPCRYILGIFRDITERKQAEASLREAEWKFRALFEKGPIGVAYHEMIYNASGTPIDYRFIDANASYRELTGVDPRGKTVRQAFPGIENDPLDWIGTFGRVARTGEQIRIERHLQLNDRWYDIVAYRYKPDHFVAAFLEITERKQAQARLREVVAELARSNKDLEQFAYVASHDLKEPLRMVTGFMSLLKERYQDKLDVTAAEYIRFAEEGGIRMQMLVDDLLAYACIGHNNRTESVDVETALDEALVNLQTRIDETGAVIARDPLPTIQASKLEMVQVFQNLIGNAIKFHREGVKPEIHVTASREGDNWLFRVRDNGVGIALEQREKVFLIFQRLHVPDKYPGTGIGLAICRKIVERHGGKIWVEANEGGGSVFCFTIPA